MNRALFTELELDFLRRMRVARLATVDDENQPHVIPIVFAMDDRNLYSPLDAKPKRVAPKQLKRVRNLVANPRVAVVADQYDEDWTLLLWVLVKGTARIVEEGEEFLAGIHLLLDKYPQYQTMPLEHRPLIVITPASVTSWTGAKPA